MGLFNGARNRNRTGTPVIHEAADFLTTMAFATSALFDGLDYTFAMAFALGPRRLVSTPSLMGLGSVLAY